MGTRRARGPLIAGVLSILLLAVSAGPAQAFSKAIWGPAFVNGVNQFPLYQQLGVSIIEQQLNWSQVAPTRPANPTNPNDPAYQWPLALQETINEASVYHMRVLIQILMSPSWANGGRAPNWVPLNPSQFAAYPAEYAAFARAAAREYPSVHLWMIWGEPERRGNFEPLTPAPWWAKKLTARQKIAPHNYARILDAAYGALKGVSHSNVVIGGDTYSAGDIWPEQWIENLRLPNGHPPRMDMYGQNPFTFSNPSFSKAPSYHNAFEFPDLPRLAKLLDHYLHRGLPIFISEYTLPTGRDEEFNYAIKPKQAAKWLTQALREARHFKRIYAFGWIHVYDNPPLTYGGLITANGVRKPDFWSFADG